MHTVRGNQWLLFSMLLLGLQGCAQRAPLPPLPAGAPADFPTQRYLSADVLAVQSGTLTVRVYRGGRLARLGHNHVITSEAVAGLLQPGPDGPTGSYADLYLPLASLVIDSDAARQAAGPDFSSRPSEKDRQGTLANLLGARLFDAAQYPYVRAAVTMTNTDRASVALTVRDHTSTHVVPVLVEPEANRMKISANWSVTHADIGLTPFSALGGAIVVADPIHLALTLTVNAP